MLFHPRSSFIRVLTLASLVLATACGTQAEDPQASSPNAQRLEETGSEEKKPDGGGGQFCGGFAGFACPEGFVCVDDPKDSCDPDQGGADCGGICEAEKKKKPKCDYNDPTLRYIARDPNECAAITYICEEGEVGFFNECGCGCQTARCDYNDPDRIYVATDPETCALIRYSCEPGQTGFSDACGCGCETAPTE